MVMEGASGAPLLQNPPSLGPPRNPPAGSPTLPLPQPPVGQFPPYRGIMPPFMYPPYLPFPAPYGPQGPYRFPAPNEAPRFARPQGGPAGGGPRGEMVKRPPILKQNDLKELDELDHDGDEGWAGAQEEIDYSAKLKFSDDEGDDDRDEEKSESKNGLREQGEQQKSQDGPAPGVRSRTSENGGNTSSTPPASTDETPSAPSSKPSWAEEGGGSWGGQAGTGPYQERAPNQSASQKPQNAPVQQQQQSGPTPPPSNALLNQAQGEDEDETWRQRRKQSSSEISAAVERARRRREEEERRMEEERRAACAEKLKRLDEKQQQQQKPPAGGEAPATSPTPSLPASASSSSASQPPSPCVDLEEPPLSSPQPTTTTLTLNANNRQRANSNSSYDSNHESQQVAQPLVPQHPQPHEVVVAPEVVKEEPVSSVAHVRSCRGGDDSVKVEGITAGAGRQGGGMPGQGFSKYQKSLPPRFQRQQQEQLLKQQQQWQQQHSQAAQAQLQTQAPQQGPASGANPQSGPKQQTLYPPSSMGRPPPLPINFDPRWMMMPYMDPRLMQSRPTPMDYYPASMHPTGLINRERSDSGGSGSEPYDRQQHGGPPHPHRVTPPMDPKLAWGPEVFPSGEGRPLSSPLRQKQTLEEEDMTKGSRSDTPPVRIREVAAGPIQPPGGGGNSSSGSTDQSVSPVGTHVSHHQPFLGAHGSYSGFPDNSSRIVSHPQQRGNPADLRGFSHQDEGPPNSQQSQIWGSSHGHFERNGRTDHPSLETNPHLQHHHPPHPSHFSLHPQKQENGQERERGVESKKNEKIPPLPLSSSCSSSSSNSSAREDNSAKHSLHHPTPQNEHEPAHGTSGGRKHEKSGNAHFHPHSSQHSLHQHHPKSNSRGREQKTETQWGPRPGSSTTVGAHNRKGGSAAGGHTSVDDMAGQMIEKTVGQTGGSHPNKRVGPIKRPVLKDMKREGEGEGVEKNSGGSSKDKEQDANQTSSKQEQGSASQASSGLTVKDEAAPSGKPRNSGKERGAGGGASKASKEGDQTMSSNAPPSRREREHSYEMGGNAPYHAGSSRGGRSNRGRGEFYGRGRGYRGSYAGNARGRAGGRSARDYRPTANSGYQHGPSNQDYKREVSSGRHGHPGSHPNPGRARNHSETRSEGSEYEEVPKRRRQRGSETGSESAASDLAHSDKEERKMANKKAMEGKAPPGGNATPSGPPRNTQTRVFTPRGVPSRRGRGGGPPGGGVYRNSGGSAVSGGHRSGSGGGSQGLATKSAVSGRKQQPPPQPPGTKVEPNRGSNGEKKEKAVEQGQSQNQGMNTSSPAAVPTPAQVSTENGNMGQLLPGTVSNSTSSTTKPVPLPDADGRNVLHRGFERPPRRRRSGRSQHQQDKPPRFRRLKQERENAARINGSSGIIDAVAAAQQQPPPVLQNSMQEPNTTSLHSTAVSAANHHVPANANNNSGGHLSGGNLNLNSHHHHHHHYHGNTAVPHSQHHHNHNPPGGAKSPDISNHNSDQANEEWETASESSDFTEFREREAGKAGGKSYPSYHHHHHHHHPPGQNRAGGGGGEREINTKESAANKRSFSSQRPGMERQNRRVSGGGGRGPRGPPGSGGPGGMSGNGGPNRGERRGNWPSPKNRK